MKYAAKLTLFFSISFIILFFAGFLFRLLSSWVEFARIIPLEELPGEDAAEAAWKILPAVLYLAMLLTLSYSARKSMGIPSSICTIIILGCAFTLGTSLGLGRADILKPALKQGISIHAEPGLILYREENAIVLLKESEDILGPRVVSFPGRPLLYQENPIGPNNSIISLPELPFGGRTPWFVRSLTIDCTLSSREIQNRFERNFLSFAAYIFSLVLLLGSFRFLLELSQWPLANIFIGAIVFRGILALETFLNAREINILIASFLGSRVPAMLITPLVFGALGTLILLYTLLSRIARRPESRPRRKRND